MRKLSTFIFLCSLLSLFALASATGWAQGTGTSGTITGTVTDPQGGSLAGAKITATNPATNFSREATSGTDGLYRISSLPVGTYTVTAEASGFKRTTVTNVVLNVNDIKPIDIKLEVGQVSETVTVTSAATTVETETSAMGNTVENKTLNDLPILSGAAGRNPLALAPLQAGVMPAGQVGPFSVNGQRAQSNNFMLDGGDSNDLAINVPDAVQGFSPDALQEFRILTNTFSAEFGRNAGSVVNVVSKSGSNNFHGTLYEYFRNRVLNATPFFNNSSPTFNGLRNPQFNVNEFGGLISGPLDLPRFGEGGRSIISGKDRTFFLFSYLGFRRRQGVTSSATVPTQAQRDIINAVGTPQARALLAEIPPPNSGSSLLSSASNSLNRNQYFLKVDHRFSSKNSLFVSFFREPQEARDPFAFSGSAIPGFGQVGTTAFTNLVASDTHVISSKTLNEFRFSWHRRNSFSVLPQNTTPPSAFGIAGINPDNASAAGPPWIVISGFSSWGNTIQGPQGRKDDTYQFVDNFSHNLGAKHALRFGGEYRKYRQQQIFSFINNGYIAFDGTCSGSTIPGLTAALSDFARGCVAEFAQSNNGPGDYRTWSINAYAQDDWKVKPYLTLNLGLRYEYDEPLYDAQNRVSTFRQGQQSTVFPTAPRGLVFPGDAGISRSTYQKDTNNFGPRVGFAWDVFHNGKVALRGGYGIFYDTVISETTLQFLGAAPYGAEPDFGPTSLANPYGAAGVANPFPFTPVSPGSPFNFASLAPLGISMMAPDVVTPYSEQWNLNTQWEFRKGYTLEVAYVGTAGHHQLTRRELNPAIVTPTSTSSFGNVVVRRIFNLNNPQNAAFGGAVFGGILYQETSTNSIYNGLEATVLHRFSNGLYFQNAYTWSHCIDEASGLRSSNTPGPPVGPGMRRDRGNCDQDIRQRDALSAIYQLPMYQDQRGPLGKLLGGWEISGVFQAQTGTPINIVDSTDRSFTGACSGLCNRPDATGVPIVFLDPRNTTLFNGTGNHYFDPTPYFSRVPATVAAGGGRFGTLGRNVFHGPGFWNLDMSFIKRTKIGENKNIEFRAEFFNIFNHTQFLNPNTTITSVNFGRITTTRDPRLIQFALKLNF